MQCMHEGLQFVIARIWLQALWESGLESGPGDMVRLAGTTGCSNINIIILLIKLIAYT